MPTLLDEPTRARIRVRMAQVGPGTQPRWGRMSAPRMLVHVTDQLRAALGEIRCEPMRTPFRFAPLRWAIVHVLPWPKGVPTAPALLTTSPAEWEADRLELEAAIERFCARGAKGTFSEHPAFGPLSAKDWGVLAYRHLDHHLRQFGA